MIPTAGKGYMPFLPNGTNHRCDAPSTMKRLSIGSNLTAHTDGQKQSPTSPNSAQMINRRPDAPKLSPPINGFVQSSSVVPLRSPSTENARPLKPGSPEEKSPTPKGLLGEASVNKEDILRKDNSWKAFLKALFRHKAEKKAASAPKGSSTKSTCMKIKKVRIKRVAARDVVQAAPLQRSHSMNAAQKTIAKLEAIVEEDLTDDIDMELILAESAPHELERIRPNSAFLDRRSLVRLSYPPGSNGLSLSDSDGSSSCESLGDRLEQLQLTS